MLLRKYWTAGGSYRQASGVRGFKAMQEAVRRRQGRLLHAPIAKVLQPGGTLKGMPEALKSEPIPLETDSDGVIRVRGTRLTLDAVWFAFSEGATAEEIVQQYPSLSLAEAYSGYWILFAASL